MNKPGNILCKHYAGSIAYGTNLPSSDVDFRGIYCDPPQGIITPWSKDRTEQWEDPSEEDTVLTELHKYMKGYVDHSPNVLETLWVEESDVVQSSEAYEYLRSQRGDLLSKKLRYTFGGYALGQMKRIKGHNKWINNPQDEHPPVRADYFKLIQNFLPQQIFARDFDIRKCNGHHILVPYGNDIYGVVESRGGSILNMDGSIRKVKYEEMSDDIKKKHPIFIVKLNEEVFKQDHETWKNYWKWRKERNETRSELEEKHGYDCYLNSETEFLTKDGFKLYDDITEDDLLATVNPKSKAVEFQKYFDRVDKPYSGEIYYGETQDSAFAVTGNHRMFWSPGRDYSDTWDYTKMEDLTEGHILRAVNNDLEDYPVLDEWMHLMALYLDCGCLVEDSHKPGWFGVSFSSLEIIEYLDNSSAHRTEHIRGGRVEYTWVIYCKALAEWLLSSCGRYAGERSLPNWITSLSSSQANHLLDNLSYYQRKHSRIYGNTSENYADKLQILAMMAGKVSKVWSYPKHGTYQTYVSDGDMNHRIWSKHIETGKVTDDRIVCFSVPNENLITRRKGKLAIQGNTKHAMHIVRLLRMGEEVLRDGVVNVKRPDVQELLDIRAGKWKYEELLEWAEHQDNELDKLIKTSPLPNKPDFVKAKKVLITAEEIANGTA